MTRTLDPPYRAPQDLDAARPPAMPQPPRPATNPPPNALAELARMISQPPAIPKIGTISAESAMRGFDEAANDIEKLGKDAHDRGCDLMQQAVTYAKILREAGQELCRRIEAETIRNYQISTIMRSTQERMAGIEAEQENAPRELIPEDQAPLRPNGGGPRPNFRAEQE